MRFTYLTAGERSPVPSIPVPDTCATSLLTDEGLVVPIYVVHGTGFEIDAVSEGQIDVAIEKQAARTFLLMRFCSLKQTSYLMAPFDALNTFLEQPFAATKAQVSSPDGLALRIWTQDEAGIVQTIRHTKVPPNLQDALLPIIRRQTRKGQQFDFDAGMMSMLRFIERTKSPAATFERARLRARVS